MATPNFHDFASRFNQPGVVAIALFGSHARGDAGEFSDIDLVRFYATDNQPTEPLTDVFDGFFTVVSDVGPSMIDDWFSKPEVATITIEGVKSAQSLWDPDGFFETVQQRAVAFVWDEEIQEKANHWASSQMVGWIEEVQKGLEGLRRNDEGRMLNARYGLSWGLTNVLRVQRGVLISGDNGTYLEIVRDIGLDSNWALLSRQAFGMINGCSLPDQVRAGLRLYILTYEVLAKVLKPEDKKLIEEAVARTRLELDGVALSIG